MSLNNERPKPKSDAYKSIKNQYNNYEYDLQIILPVYNDETYIRSCIDSAISQYTNYKFQLIVINDGSTDNTENIINEYNYDPRIKIINQENKGLSGARNTGLKYINSYYVLFLDSDDKLCDNSISYLLDMGFRHNSDIVIGGYYLFNNKSNYFSIDYNEDYQVKSLNKLNGYPWGKLIKSSLFEYIQFPDDYIYEDTIISFLLYPLCNKISLLHKIVYKYRKNISGITQTSVHTNKSIDSFWITELMLNDCRKLNIKNKKYIYDMFLNQVKINCLRNIMKNNDVQKSIFVLTTHLYNTFFYYFINDDSKKNKLEKSLINNDYRNYIIFCLFN